MAGVGEARGECAGDEGVAMSGKLYYLTTLGGWRRHAERFVHSHWFAVEAHKAIDEASKIFVVVDADEGAHNALQDDPEFEALPHPMITTGISEAGQTMLSPFGITAGANTFEVAEAMARMHPLLRHRVF
jgi:hypothetical protein